jgi:hypothetical protein
MKMDAAEPFNAPVNPDALGIPVSWYLDYYGAMLCCFMFVME